MADLPWPPDLVPYKVMFYLQPHVGGSESPITRTRKVYGLSAPRWMARYVFRAGYGGAPRLHDQAGFGPRLDALIADLEGGLNNALLWDFRRPRPLHPQAWRSRDVPRFRAAAIGASELVIDGFSPHSIAFSIGDYVGGDGRPHLVRGGGIVTGAGSIMADAAGTATITVRPPLSAPIAAATPLAWPVTGRFKLTSEDAGQNETEVGQPTEYTLDFAEDLL
ncbi:hypothetical protein [Sphingomonas bacterium]|uniref:hypothetical protein n=1 Tax=Sphingomonas bacterium TaxID=1895847 RepID=UPI001576A947|nr:hypothetical protein [Sphingomonas bacterium]